MPVRSVPSREPATVPTPAGGRPAGRRAGRTWSRGVVASVLIAAMALLVAPASLPAGSARAATESCERTDFTDVPAGAAFRGDIMWMACRGITVGYADGTFRPGQPITRGEMAAFLYRQVRPEVTVDQQRDFSDVAPGGPHFTAISWLADTGATVGRADGTFGPGEPVTRGELTAFLYRLADESSTPPATSPFTDLGPSSPNYRAITWAAARGITAGFNDGSFRQQQDITRGHASAFLHRAHADLVGTRPPSGRPPTSFTVRGSGWGHGAGMSQYGARAMAEEGRSVEHILRYYYSGADVTQSAHRAATNISVHLASPQSTTIQATRLAGGTPGLQRVRIAGTVLQARGAVRLAADGGAVLVTMPDGKRKRSASAVLEWPGTRFWSPDSSEAATVRVPAANGSQPLDLRHGKLVISVVNGKLNVVTELRMNDEYLYGLAEMPSSWPATALQAQAVAGRSYALRNMNTLKAECGCHVWDEVRSQKFTGWAKENEGGGRYGNRWKAAVDATVTRARPGDPTSSPVAAKSLWHRGSIIDATYFSSSGGHTRSAQDVWGNAVPYLQGRPDPYSLSAAANNPNASWTQTISQAAMAQAFGLPSVHSVRFTRDGAGSVQYVTATAANGATARITGNQLRSRAGLKSTWVASITAR
ncbi:SpoIID/LytB domain-containing protein [Citricoccus sp.]|uniref:SpoIID/LytB domain-containing protein n=1 Tax=Citricoccus sp. TaxID=1978372 RepID=UPI00260EAB77|nr:SpoIID/LytB domain-containing protein [Citricoccus sp.]HRO30522.1 SpoIID/LytB domain-containing protein [Citricoccus sp.]HRO93862.1 SpoIID/LytB domain-containing protein [Citricoccus sp.]